LERQAAGTRLVDRGKRRFHSFRGYLPDILWLNYLKSLWHA
jgi:hypothetical protein